MSEAANRQSESHVTDPTGDTPSGIARTKGIPTTASRRPGTAVSSRCQEAVVPIVRNSIRERSAMACSESRAPA